MINDIVPANQYVYWIAYHFGDGSRSGLGGCRIFSPVLGNSLAWLESVRTWIQDQNPVLGTVLIINWQRLEGDEQWDTPEPAIQRFHFHHDDA